MASQSRILLVPAGADDVPISLDELPSMQDDEWEVIISLLSGDSGSSRPHPSLWTRMAFEYFKTNRTDHAIELLSKGTQILKGTDIASTLHSMLSFHFLNKVKTSPKTILDNPRYQDLNKVEKDKSYHLNDSTKHSGTANALAPRNQVSILNKALLLLETGKNDESLSLLENILNSQPRHTIALFAKACILLRKRNYQSALLIYQNLLKLTLSIDQKAKMRRESQMELDGNGDQEGVGEQDEGWKGPDPRIGIGLCLLGLNRPSDAIKAWQRAASLQPNASAPNLLLGLTALNTAKQLAPLSPGTYGYSPSSNLDAGIDGCSEEEARQRAYKAGIDHIQKAWKGDNKNAMTAIILAEHISSRASALASSNVPGLNYSDIMVQFNKALKLCEHAIQYADSRAAFIQASLIFARTSHLASEVAATAAANDPAGTSLGGEMGNESVELRAQALKHYQKVVDDLNSQTSSSSNSLSAASSQSMNVVGGGNVLPNGLALATLGLAQLQVLRNEELAAMNTLERLLSKNWSSSSNYSTSSLLEPNILSSSLRYFSHAGANQEQKAADFLRAKIGLERTLRIINATCREVYLRLNSDDSSPEETEESKKYKVEISKEEEEEEKTWESRRTVEGLNDNPILSRAVSRTALVNESLSLDSFKNMANLFNSPKIHVLMAQLCQKGQSDSDIERSIQEWRIAAEKEEARLGISLKNLKDNDFSKADEWNDLVCCLINQNALLVLKGLEEKPDWDPLAKPDEGQNSEEAKSSSNLTFSNPVRTEILSEAVGNLSFLLELLSKIESKKPAASSTSQFFSSSMSNGSDRLEVDPLRLIISYNLARALEGIAEEKRAVEIYDRILEHHPEYTDAKVRKALIYLGGSSKSYSSRDGIITGLLYNPRQGSSPSKLIPNWNRDLSNSLFKESLLSDPTSLSVRLSYVSFLSGSLPCSRYSTWSVVKDILAEPFMGSNPQGIQLFGSAAVAKSMAETARKDSFTLAALGWVYYNLALQAKPGPNFKKEREKGMLRSSDLFDKALTEDSRNCFAAQGLAVLLAEDAVGEATFNAINSNSLPVNTKDPKLNNENQQLLTQVKYLNSMSTDQRRKLGADESLSILGKLRELKDNEHVQTCIGHANMMKEEFERAAKAFEQASTRYLCNSDPTVLQHLSRATYAQATRTSSFEMIETSLVHLKSALSILESRLTVDGKNPSLNAEVNFVRYNIAVISQKGLSMLYDKKCEKRDRGMIERAVKNVEDAQRIFESLAPIAAENKLAHISAEVLDQRSQYGSTSLLRVAARHLNEQTVYEQRVAAAREEVANAKREKEARILAQRREMEENLKEKNRLLAEQRKKEKEEVGTWEYRKDLPEDGKRRTGGGERRKSKKRKEDVGENDMDTDGEIDDALFGGKKGGDISSGESDLNDENKEKRREERINDLKRKKMNEKKSKNPSEKKKKKKEKKIKKKKGPQLSDGEDEGGEGKEGGGASDSGSESDAPKRKKPKKMSKKAAAQEDLIDTDEEI